MISMVQHDLVVKEVLRLRVGEHAHRLHAPHGAGRHRDLTVSAFGVRIHEFRLSGTA